MVYSSLTGILLVLGVVLSAIALAATAWRYVTDIRETRESVGHPRGDDPRTGVAHQEADRGRKSLRARLAQEFAAEHPLGTTLPQTNDVLDEVPPGELFRQWHWAAWSSRNLEALRMLLLVTALCGVCVASASHRAVYWAPVATALVGCVMIGGGVRKGAFTQRMGEMFLHIQPGHWGPVHWRLFVRLGPGASENVARLFGSLLSMARLQLIFIVLATVCLTIWVFGSPAPLRVGGTSSIKMSATGAVLLIVAWASRYLWLPRRGEGPTR